MNKESIVHLLKNLDVSELSGEKVMIDFETGYYFLLHGSANEVWDIISKTDARLDDIVNNLMKIYNVDYDTCYASVEKFIKELAENELVQIL